MILTYVINFLFSQELVLWEVDEDEVLNIIMDVRAHDAFQYVSSFDNNASLMKQQSFPLKTHYRDSEPTSLCSFSLMLSAKLRSNKYQF
jgi:hypothetical protein